MRALLIFLFGAATISQHHATSHDLQSLEMGFEEVDEFSHEPTYPNSPRHTFRNLSMGLWQSLSASAPKLELQQPSTTTESLADFPPVNHRRFSDTKKSTKKPRHHKKAKTKLSAPPLTAFGDQDYDGGGGGIARKRKFGIGAGGAGMKKKQSQRGQRLRNSKHGNLFSLLSHLHTLPLSRSHNNCMKSCWQSAANQLHL